MCQCNNQSGGCGCSSNSCGCGCQSKKSCGCQSSSCGQHGSCSSGGSCDFSKELLKLADAAWKEVLFEELKSYVRANDSKIKEIAALVGAANHDKWQHKLSADQCCSNFESKIKEFFKNCSSGQCKK